MSITLDNSENGAGVTALAVFVRLPRAGKVKSRLARSLGAEKATKFYRLCVEQILEEFSRVPGFVEKYAFFSDLNDRNEIERWAGPWFRVLPQVKGDLGARLIQAFRQMFDRGACRVIITASDVPDLTAEIISGAVNALAGHDVVLGPSHDGGYYLVGMNRPHEELFHNITWSTERVFRETLKKIEELGLSVGSMPVLHDIDTETDLRQWLEATRDDGRRVLAYARIII
jgi:rSAM/selenodomain-associated transferase 1